MNIFFDVDATIIGYDGSLRPGVRETFVRLREQGHAIYLWSGIGTRWDVVERHGLRPLVSGCFTKPLSDHRARLQHLGVPVVPDFCVDDYHEIVDAFGGVRVRAYDFPDRKDQEMHRVYHIITAATIARPSEPTA